MKRNVRYEKRYFSFDREVRIRYQDGGPAVIEGHAAVFNCLSEDLGGWREVILPGAFDRCMKEGSDVRCLDNHDSCRLLGRTRSGTLRLTVDEAGLAFECELPDTSVGRDVRVLVERGDLTGCSFGFYTVSDSWKTQDRQIIREVRDVDVFDVSTATYPAYPDTDVALRALNDYRQQQATERRGLSLAIVRRRLQLLDLADL